LGTFHVKWTQFISHPAPVCMKNVAFVGIMAVCMYACLSLFWVLYMEEFEIAEVWNFQNSGIFGKKLLSYNGYILPKELHQSTLEIQLCVLSSCMSHRLLQDEIQKSTNLEFWWKSGPLGCDAMSLGEQFVTFEGIAVLWNAGNFSFNDSLSHCSRLEYSVALVWEPQILCWSVVLNC
jgi:hypothetical protein